MEICSPAEISCDFLTNTNSSSKTPKVKIESTTIYKSSYLDHNGKLIRQRALPVKCGRGLSNISAKIDFNTVHTLSYKKLNREPATPIIPKSRLAFTGPRDVSTTYRNSYSDYTFTKTFPYKPRGEKTRKPAPMYFETVMKKSYTHPGKTEKVYSAHRRQFWQTSFKSDYKSVNHLSYADPKVFPKKVRHRTERFPVSIKMNCDTTYRLSYQTPRQ